LWFGLALPEAIQAVFPLSAPLLHRGQFFFFHFLKAKTNDFHDVVPNLF
jgi:hypothetical protein